MVFSRRTRDGDTSFGGFSAELSVTPGFLGQRKPTLVSVVDAVITGMGAAYPELEESRTHLLETTHLEEVRFLSTIEGGIARFDEATPDNGILLKGEEPVLSGSEAFKLYDTFGFPLDLTELMAAERGYTVDVEAFEEALEGQRERSRADRAQRDTPSSVVNFAEGWTSLLDDTPQRFLGYEHLNVDTELLALRISDDGVGFQLAENPFYAEGGGQISDTGWVEGEGWSIAIVHAHRVGDCVAVWGPDSEGVFTEGRRGFLFVFMLG